MKSKICANIDSELIDIIKNCSDQDLDSIIQDALSQYFGVKQIWVRTDTLHPISPVIQTPIQTQESDDINENDKEESDDINENNKVKERTERTFKRRRQPKFVLKIWDKIKKELGSEFTVDDYWEATKKCNLDYKESARHSTILEHLKLLEETANIMKISDRPKTYRKLEIEDIISGREKEQREQKEKEQIEHREQKEQKEKEQIEHREQKEQKEKEQIEHREQDKGVLLAN